MNESEKQKSESRSQVPPGFRFHPTDEELLDYYLRKKVGCENFELDVIKDVDLNKLEPWDLKEKCNIGSSVHQTDWYFFSHKDKKYPTGTRTNRATAAGFWKATGRDKSIFSNAKCIGLRKTLVFYRGRAPHGQKSDWIMHEYRLDDTGGGELNPAVSGEEGWVVCRVFKKRNMLPKTGRDSNGDKNRNTVTSEIEDDYEEADYSSYSRQIHGATACPSSSICKQEVEEEDSSFHHLPPLQSPNEISSNPSYYTPLSGLFRSGGVDILMMHEQEHGCIKSAAGDELQTYCCSYLNTRVADLVEGGGMDWSSFETVRHNNYPSPLVSDNHQAAPSTSSSRQQQPALEFPSAYDVELWNFCR